MFKISLAVKHLCRHPHNYTLCCKMYESVHIIRGTMGGMSQSRKETILYSVITLKFSRLHHANMRIYLRPHFHISKFGFTEVTTVCTKRNVKHYIIFNNLRTIKDEHFKLTGDLDWHVPYQLDEFHIFSCTITSRFPSSCKGTH